MLKRETNLKKKIIHVFICAYGIVQTQTKTKKLLKHGSNRSFDYIILEKPLAYLLHQITFCGCLKVRCFKTQTKNGINKPEMHY